MDIRIEPLGDRALMVRDLPAPAWLWAEWIEGLGIEGLIEAFASYETVGLEIDPNRFRSESIPTFPPDRAAAGVEPLTADRQPIDVPVCYAMGEDLEDAAATLRLSTEEVVALHSSAVYRCEAVGFCPGFPYLSGLDSRLHGIPRRASPRTRVEPGSVAITGAQCGIYPLPRPGGWAILGRTPLTLVCTEDDYFPIRAGDQIRFVPIDAPDYERLRGERLRGERLKGERLKDARH